MTKIWCDYLLGRGGSVGHQAIAADSLRPLTSLQHWSDYPNLRLRPYAPNAGRGRLQRQIRRAFQVHGKARRTSIVGAGGGRRVGALVHLETIAVRGRNLAAQ